MAPRKRLCKRALHAGQYAPGESSTQGEAPATFRKDHPCAVDPHLMLSGRVRTILTPRYADLHDIARFDPELVDMLVTQGWTEFLTGYTSFYPQLVQQFYSNLVEGSAGLYTHVRGTKISVTSDIFSTALEPGSHNSGKSLGKVKFDENAIANLMLGYEVEQIPGGMRKLKANLLPPRERLLHHMITTIIYPRGGSREEIIQVHKAIFHCIYRHERLNIGSVMVDLITKVLQQPSRLLPYASQLTAVFKMYEINLENEQETKIKKCNIYQCGNIARYLQLLDSHLDENSAEVVYSYKRQGGDDEDASSHDNSESDASSHDTSESDAPEAEHMTHQPTASTFEVGGDAGEEDFASQQGEVRRMGLAVASISADLAALRTDFTEYRTSTSHILEAQTQTLAEHSQILREILSRLPPPSQDPTLH